jgi:transcriptional regulator with XRE-family HTH domain
MEIHTSTKSVIKYAMPAKQAPKAFVVKVKARMGTENLGVRELAKILGVSHPTVTELVTHGNRPSLDTAIALAKWLKQSDVSVLREAGLLPPGPSEDINFDDWKHLLSQMTPEDEAEMRQIAELKIERRKKDQSLKALNSKKA